MENIKKLSSAWENYKEVVNDLHGEWWKYHNDVTLKDEYIKSKKDAVDEKLEQLQANSLGRFASLINDVREDIKSEDKGYYIDISELDKLVNLIKLGAEDLTTEQIYEMVGDYKNNAIAVNLINKTIGEVCGMGGSAKYLPMPAYAEKLNNLDIFESHLSSALSQSINIEPSINGDLLGWEGWQVMTDSVMREITSAE